jgi:hypothetical protein
LYTIDYIFYFIFSGVSATPLHKKQMNTPGAKNNRAATTKNLNEMATTRTRVAEVREQLLLKEYEDHKARQDKLFQYQLKSMQLTVAIKRRRLLNLRRGSRGRQSLHKKL